MMHDASVASLPERQFRPASRSARGNGGVIVVCACLADDTIAAMTVASRPSQEPVAAVGGAAGGAAALLALLAVAMMVAGAGPAGGPASRIAAADFRPALTESQTVRALAAAVVAAARDLVGAERVHTAIPASGLAVVAAMAAPIGPPLRNRGCDIPGPLLLAERQLDLPPPVC